MDKKAKAAGGSTVQTQRTVQQYRAIDLTLFAIILAVFETVVVRAANRWFPGEAWTISIVPAVTAIVMVRWGPWCAIHAAAGGVVTVLASGGTGTQFLIYGLGNLAALAVLIPLRKWGWEKLHGNVLLNFLFSILIVLGMQAGRAVCALVSGMPADRLLLFVTTDSITYIFTLTVVWIASRLDGILEDQKHYLDRLAREAKR
jgi:hypothetical protein